MNKGRKLTPFTEHLEESLKKKSFAKAWRESEPEYLLSKQIIEKRLKQKLSQRSLAKKAKTTQSLICRIEQMQANPSLDTMKRIAKSLNSQLIVSLK